MQASVKVMRSHDYCHFEVALSADCETIDDVDALRKQAAILADEAVRQYKLARTAEQKRERSEHQVRQLLDAIARVKERPESDWSASEAAMVRGASDRDFWKEYEEDCYMYDSDPERDHHFSMLRRFKNVTVRAG